MNYPLMSYLFWYIVGSFVIGIPMGLLSIWVWNKGRKQYDYRATGGFWGYILYPSTASERRVGYNPTIVLEFCCGIFDENLKWGRLEKTNYVLVNMVFYPIRIVFNLIVLFGLILNYNGRD